SLIRKPDLAPYQSIRDRRRGYGGSLAPTGPFGVKDMAPDARALLKTLDVKRARIVGHSSGGITALQRAIAGPSSVHSPALPEPAMLMVPSRAGFREAITPALAKYAAGDKPGTVHSFISMMAGEDWRASLERTIPGGPEQATADAATFPEVELPAVED